MEPMTYLENILIDGAIFTLPKMNALSVTGEDAETFLQGQLTKNIKNLNEDHYFPCARLCPKGKIKFNFLIKKIKKNSFELLILDQLVESIKEDLDKFIIMEDVSLKIVEVPNLEYRSGKKSLDTENLYSKAVFGFDEGALFEVENKELYEIEPKLSLLGMYSFFTGEESQLISNSIAASVALDLEKGCFVGQEVAAKIENNRGGALFPFLIFKNDDVSFHEFSSDLGIKVVEFKNFMEFKLKRDHRIHKTNSGSFTFLDYEKIGLYSVREKANYLFLRSVGKLTGGDSPGAKSDLEQALKFDPKNIDCLEALGVIFGEEKNYEEAHKCMDKIIELSPKHIMARTNKSLFYMREGKIDEAEKEKEISAQLSLDSFSVESDEKKLEKLKSQRGMYEEVLALDERDTFALQKYIELSIELDDLEEAASKVSHFISIYPSNPKAFLLDLKIKKERGILNNTDIEIAKKVCAKSGDKSTLEEIENMEL